MRSGKKSSGSILSSQKQAEQSRKKLRQLRARTAEIEDELELRAQVAHEQERFCKAERALCEKNRTLAERKAQEEDIRKGQILFPRTTQIGERRQQRRSKTNGSKDEPWW